MQELLAYEVKLQADRQRRERRLEDQRGQSALLQQANAALLQRQYPQQQSDLDQDGSGGSPGEGQQQGQDAAGDAAKAVRSLCRLTGSSGVRQLLEALLPQQVGDQ